MTPKAPSEPDPQLAQVWPDGAPGLAGDADDLPVGQDGLQARDQVLDAAVAGGELAGAARGDEAADLGEVDRLRVVAGGVAALPQPSPRAWRAARPPGR